MAGPADDSTQGAAGSPDSGPDDRELEVLATRVGADEQYATAVLRSADAWERFLEQLPEDLVEAALDCETLSADAWSRYADIVWEHAEGIGVRRGFPSAPLLRLLAALAALTERLSGAAMDEAEAVVNVACDAVEAIRAHVADLPEGCGADWPAS